MIPVSEPLLGQRETDYVSRCMASGWISGRGQFVDEFERRWAHYCGRRDGVAVNTGTSALQIAVDCLDLEPGG